MVYICAGETDFDNFMISLQDKTGNSLWLWYIYLYIVCDHQITQAMQFAETSFFSILALTEIWVLTLDYFLRNFIKVLTVISGV